MSNRELKPIGYLYWFLLLVLIPLWVGVVSVWLDGHALGISFPYGWVCVFLGIALQHAYSKSLEIDG